MLGAKELLDVALFWRSGERSLFAKAWDRAIIQYFHHQYFLVSASLKSYTSLKKIAFKRSIVLIHLGTNSDKINKLISGILLI